MAVIAADLVIIGAANHQETDAGTPQGGAQAKEKKMVFLTDLTGNDKIELVSDDAADTTRQFDVVGKDGGGSDVTENLTLTGTTPVVTAATYERFNKVVQTVGGGTPGTVTVRNDANTEDLVLLEDAAASKTGVIITEARKLLIGLVVPVAKDKFYEKVFYYNGNSATTLTSAVCQLSDASDPTNTDIFMGLESVLDDTVTVTNRLTLPGGPTFVDNQVNQNVANSQNHTADAAQGVWLEIEVDSIASAAKNSFNLRESGQTV